MKHNILKISIKCDSCDKLFDRRLDKIEKYKNNSKNQNLCKNCYTNFRRKERLDTTNPLAKEVVGYTTKYPQYSIDCSYCNKTFIVSYGLRHRVFCSKSCQLKGADRITVKKKRLKKYAYNVKLNLNMEGVDFTKDRKEFFVLKNVLTSFKGENPKTK